MKSGSFASGRENPLQEAARPNSERMRESGGALKEMAIVERNPPDTGCVSGRAVAQLDTQVAIATAANSFVVIQLNGSAGRIAVGERLTVRMQRGVATLEERIGRER